MQQIHHMKRERSTMKIPTSISLLFIIVPLLQSNLTTATETLTSPLGPVVSLGYAAYAGNTTTPTGIPNGPVTFFGGIPYARPPLGELRWRAPQMLDESVATTEVMDARSWGPPCLQWPAQVGIGDEDCLNVNVWIPTGTKEGDELPVVVYIHGGGFYAGSPEGFPLYDWVAQHPTGLVGVSITYRLGMMGFLGGPTVVDSGANDLTLNAGLLDQRAALEWVQRHIGKFGGDKDNVAIYGESAGGASVVMQIVAYGGTKPAPFKRATAQSIGFGPTSTDEEIEETFKNAVGFVGCPISSPNTLPCMRNASIGALVSAINRTPNGKFSPVVEKPSSEAFLPALPSALIRSGNFSLVEFTGGHCTGDGKTFAGGSPADFVTAEDVERIVFERWPRVDNETKSQALAMYPLSSDLNPTPFQTEWDRAWTMAGEVIFTCMDWFLAEALLSKGRQSKHVFSYAWNAPDTVLFNARPYLGAMHTSDLYFLFDGTNTIPNAGNTFTSFNNSESTLSKEAIAYWTSFAQSGDPSTAKLSTSPSWDPFGTSESLSNRQRLLIQRGEDGSLKTASVMQNVTLAERERCAFWMSEGVTEQTRV